MFKNISLQKKVQKEKVCKKRYVLEMDFSCFRVGKPQKRWKHQKKQNKKRKKEETHTHIKCEKIRGQLKKDKECCFQKNKKQKEIRRSLFFSRWQFLGGHFLRMWTMKNNKREMIKQLFCELERRTTFPRQEGITTERVPGLNLKGFF